MRDVAESQTPLQYGRGSRPRMRKRKQMRSGCLIPLAVFVALVAVIIWRQAFFDDPQGSDATSASASASTSASASASPTPDDSSPTSAQPSGPVVRYISTDGSALDPDVSLVSLFESDLRLPSNAFNGLNSALGLPDELTRDEEGRRVGHWDLAGSASIEVVEGNSISIFCGPENTIAAHVGDGVILCRSTLEEANRLTSDGIGVFEFGPNATPGGPGDWIVCGSDVSTANAHLEFRVNATADDTGSSASEAAPTDIINGLRLSACTSE